MKLYERTDIYDLFQTPEADQGVKRHWEKLLGDRDIATILDCSIGTGNLTLPLLELGVKVTGSDLNDAMLLKCKEKSKRFGGNDGNFAMKQSDFRELNDNIKGTFDCVASTGNSLPYVTNSEVLEVLEQMDRLVKEKGYLYFDMRNWDNILSERNRFYLYHPQFQEETRINLVQVWDYLPDDSMLFHLLYTFEKENKIIQKEIFEEHYYPISRQLMLNKLEEMGYQDIKVMCHPAYFDNVDVDKVDWYCVIGQKNRKKDI